jgi:hypothetical protein
MTEQDCIYQGKSEQHHTPSHVRVALPVGVGWWMGMQKRDLILVVFDKMNKIMVKRALVALSSRGTHVGLIAWYT